MWIGVVDYQTTSLPPSQFVGRADFTVSKCWVDRSRDLRPNISRRDYLRRGVDRDNPSKLSLCRGNLWSEEKHLKSSEATQSYLLKRGGHFKDITMIMKYQRAISMDSELNETFILIVWVDLDSLNIHLVSFSTLNSIKYWCEKQKPYCIVYKIVWFVVSFWALIVLFALLTTISVNLLCLLDNKHPTVHNIVTPFSHLNAAKLGLREFITTTFLTKGFPGISFNRDFSVINGGYFEVWLWWDSSQSFSQIMPH